MGAVGVNAWKQAGRVYLWRYVEEDRHFPGWHLAVDALGLASLCDLLKRAAAATDASLYRTVRIEPPPAPVLSVPKKPAPVRVPPRLRIVLAPSAEGVALEEQANDAVITMGTEGARALLAWFSAPERAFDTTFPSSPPVWFWGVHPDGSGSRAG